MNCWKNVLVLSLFVLKCIFSYTNYTFHQFYIATKPSSVEVKAFNKGDKTGVYAGVYLSTGVLQVTWQRSFKDEHIENLATYSKRFGQQVNEPYQGKIVFTEASLSSTAIMVKNVTWRDESCYICSFNVYPGGSKRRQTCLRVKGKFSFISSDTGKCTLTSLSRIWNTLNLIPDYSNGQISKQAVFTLLNQWTQCRSFCDCSTVYPGISAVATAAHISAEGKENNVEITFTCSATGKPPPTIQWDLSTPDLRNSQSQTATVTNGDSTFTSSRNVSLQVPSGWNGHVDCVVNSGITGERRERIPLSLDPGKKKKDKGMYAYMWKWWARCPGQILNHDSET